MTKYKVIICSLLLLLILFAILLAHKDNQLKQAKWLAVTQYKELKAINNNLVDHITELQDFKDLRRLKEDLGK